MNSLALMLLQAAYQFAEGMKEIDGVEVVGEPDMCVVAIKSTSKKLNIYKVNDLMSQRGLASECSPVPLQCSHVLHGTAH